MVETVEQIEPTERQRPAHTPPGEVAVALRALAFSTSDAAQDAYHRVLFAVGNDHADSYFPVVLDAVCVFSARSSQLGRGWPAREHLMS